MSHAANEPAQAGAPRSRIVVVDDEPDMLDLLCAILRSARPDADVVPYAAPGDALRAEAQGGIDLLVTDFMMPGANGLELTRRLRSLQPDLPVIMLTALSDASVQNDAFVERVNVFMKKPVEPREFLKEVHRVMAAAGGKVRRTEIGPS